MRTTNFDITTSPTLVPWKDLIKCRRKSAVPPRSKKESIRMSLRYLRDELNSRKNRGFVDLPPQRYNLVQARRSCIVNRKKMLPNYSSEISRCPYTIQLEAVKVGMPSRTRL
ncbi:unnamed protein product, partial [Nesidiocoris tenuis]